MAASYPLLSPRFFAEDQNDILINFLPLRRSLRELVRPFGNTFGMYFEYLPSGTSIGVNEKEEFMSASLIKVPVVMAYFRQVEETGLSLDDQAVRLEERDIDRNFGSLWQRGIGAGVTYGEAVRRALVESDNTATMVLANRVLQEYFDIVYEGLDIDFTKVDGRVIVSPKQYASILKSLYLSSVLTKASSQKILQYLTQSTVHDKLPAGVPRDIIVSHKFGINDREHVHQDCGIVYVPKRPYILCMMSRSTEDEARTRMVQVSRTVYEYVRSVNGQRH